VICQSKSVFVTRHSGNYCDDHCSPSSAESAPLPKVDFKSISSTDLTSRSLDRFDRSTESTLSIDSISALIDRLDWFQGLLIIHANINLCLSGSSPICLTVWILKHGPRCKMHPGIARKKEEYNRSNSLGQCGIKTYQYINHWTTAYLRTIMLSSQCMPCLGT